MIEQTCLVLLLGDPLLFKTRRQLKTRWDISSPSSDGVSIQSRLENGDITRPLLEFAYEAYMLVEQV